jgi:hypothetical protein
MDFHISFPCYELILELLERLEEVKRSHNAIGTLGSISRSNTAGMPVILGSKLYHVTDATFKGPEFEPLS